jgi:tripartite-type tricarboxylate transporter receptor subunit TctC
MTSVGMAADQCQNEIALRDRTMKAFAAIARMMIGSILVVMAMSAAAQQAYPNKPIRFIVPFPAGGPTDPLVRMVAQKLTESWGQPVIVDFRPGGNTIIGTEALARSQPDGYTIVQISITHVVLPLLFQTPYDPFKDFAPVATLARTEYLLVLHPSVPANNLQEFIALAKSKPGQLNHSAAGNGTITHLGAEMFVNMTGVKIQNIPYKGSAPALTDLIGGQVQFSLQSMTPVIPHIKAGRVKAIAITGEQRSPALPQVPTFTEAGLPGFELTLWYGVLAPAGTPRTIIDKLSTEIAKILTMPDIREKLVGQGQDPLISTPEQLVARMRADSAKYGRIIKTANIRLEE